MYMKMNNYSIRVIYYISIAFVILIGAAGCKKDLGSPAQSFLDQSQIFSDAKDATAAVTGIYTQLATLKNNVYDLVGVVGTDEIRVTYFSHGWGDYWAGLGAFDDYDIKLNSQNQMNSGFWRTCYQGVVNANNAIAGLPSTPFSDAATKNRLIGEAKFMRALFYFYLVQLYGDIPLRTEAQSPSEGLKRTPKDSVYALIISDLKYATTNLWPKAQNPDAGRANIEAAKALLGKVYLTLHDYHNAKTVFEDLITNNNIKLLSNYGDLFDGQHENNAESLFEIQYSTDNKNNTQGLQNLYGAWYPCYLGQTWNSKTPDYGGQLTITTLYYSDSVWDKVNDKRYLLSIWPHHYANGGNLDTWDGGRPNSRKYDISSSDIDYSNSGKNLYYLRASDVYLMYAEVLNELGQTTSALVPLNKVRNRAGLQNFETVVVSNPSQEQLRTELLNERTRELGAEGWRWFDLKRTGTLLSRVLLYNNPQVTYNNAAYATQQISTKNLVLPIPLNELQTNPGLTLADQNSGY